MPKYTHNFLEQYEGFLGFGFSREVDEATITCYLQMFSDDQLMGILRKRLSHSDMERLFDFLTGLMKKYLTDDEYHSYFLKDGQE